MKCLLYILVISKQQIMMAFMGFIKSDGYRATRLFKKRSFVFNTLCNTSSVGGVQASLMMSFLHA